MYEDERSVYLVMELMRGGELVERIVGLKIFSEREAAAVLNTLVGAIQYLHQNGVCICTYSNETSALTFTGLFLNCAWVWDLV